MQAPMFGSFGETLDDIQRTEFFAFFHLVEEGRQPAAAGRELVRHRPVNPKFAPHVACDVLVQPNDTIDRVALHVDGRFIDAPATAPLARDIVRSFIGAGVVTQQDVEVVADVIRDLRYRTQSDSPELLIDESTDPDAVAEAISAALARGEQVFARRRVSGEEPPTALSAVPSRGYAVYEGTRDAFARELAATNLTMQNTEVNEERQLSIVFTPH